MKVCGPLLSVIFLLVTACTTLRYDARLQDINSPKQKLDFKETEEVLCNSLVEASYFGEYHHLHPFIVALSSKYFRVLFMDGMDTKIDCTFEFGTKESRQVTSSGNIIEMGPSYPRCKIFWTDIEPAQAFADALMSAEKLAQAGMIKSDAFEKELRTKEFKKKAVSYRANPKPLTEEVHKYQVLAERAFDDKAYEKAIEYYGNALEVAPWWVDGHYNRALLLAKNKNFQQAIDEMGMYLELVPNSKDSRTVRDQLYIWEAAVKATPLSGTSIYALPDEHIICKTWP